ncbi:MAG: hypothetical protein ACK4E8_12545 [Lacibacter sp.]
MDTIYIADCTYGMDYYFKNDGCVIVVNLKDTIRLRAVRGSRKLPLNSNLKGHGIYPTPIVETVRIIKPANEVLRLDIHSSKTMWKKHHNVHDTTLFFTPECRNLPWMYINILKINYRPYQYQMRMTNEEFAWKNNYQKPRIRRRLEASVVYEYRYPERSLTPIRKHR